METPSTKLDAMRTRASSWTRSPLPLSGDGACSGLTDRAAHTARFSRPDKVSILAGALLFRGSEYIKTRVFQRVNGVNGRGGTERVRASCVGSVERHQRQVLFSSTESRDVLALGWTASDPGRLHRARGSRSRASRLNSISSANRRANEQHRRDEKSQDGRNAVGAS